MKATNLSDDGKHSNKDASTTNTGQCATKDKNLHARRNSTYQGADLENENADKEGVFGGSDGENLAAGQHETRLCEEVTRDNPCYLAEGVETRNDHGYCG